MKRSDTMRDEIEFPGKIKKIGNGYYVSVLKKYVESLGATEGTEIDVCIRIVSRGGEKTEE